MKSLLRNWFQQDQALHEVPTGLCGDSMDLRKRKCKVGFVPEACGRRGINVRNNFVQQSFYNNVKPCMDLKIVTLADMV